MSSANPNLDELINEFQKRKLVVYNKRDLVPKGTPFPPDTFSIDCRHDKHITRRILDKVVQFPDTRRSKSALRSKA